MDERERVPPDEAGDRAERDGGQVGDGPVQQDGGGHLRTDPVVSADGQDADQPEFGDSDTAGGNRQRGQQPDEREGRE